MARVTRMAAINLSLADLKLVCGALDTLAEQSANLKAGIVTQVNEAAAKAEKAKNPGKKK